MSSKPLESAIHVLRGLVAQHSAPGSRLPTVRELALQCGVSTNTMWKAVHGLVGEGVLSARQRQGIRVVGESQSTQAGTDHAVAQDTSKRRWERVADDIRRQIIEGRYSVVEVLPTRKELKARYGVSYRTVQQALAHLRETGFVVPHGRGVRVAGSTEARVKASVLAVTWGIRREAGYQTQVHDKHPDWLRLLEEACGYRGVRVRPAIVGLARYGSREVTRLDRDDTRLFTEDELDSALGVALLVGSPTDADLSGFARLAVSRGLPVALLDRIGEPQIGASLTANRLVRTFQCGVSSDAGRGVGRYLYRRGHRQVAYLSAHGSELFSRNRLQGLADGMGADHGVAEVTELHLEPPKELVTGFEKGLERNRLLFELMDYCRNKGGQGFLDLADAIHGERFVVMSCMARRETYRRLRDLYTRALTIRDATAWVCATDLVAVGALDFLRQKGIHVPGTISVLGFDNSAQAHQERITSFDFGCSALASAMAHHAIGGRPPAMRPSPVYEVEGMVVDRETVGWVTDDKPRPSGISAS